ncbi:haloacid dehalogenase-like hydrolase, partial [Paenibacillus sp.]|uniref:haloacid dehalogenase-like hydrolase n=1 Tax=Paenibacillus sp. TaxID=58172 RepID=UPI00281E17D1
DFDGTIYNGDSSVDFYFYCLRRFPSLCRFWPGQFYAAMLFKLGKIDLTGLKERLYRYFKGVADMDGAVSDFWAQNIHKINEFYRRQARADDVIISASPYFLLKPVCGELGVRRLIASDVSEKDGVTAGVNCRGVEKVRRFREAFPSDEVNEFYSDSPADGPLAEIAQRAFMVQDGKILPWPG